MLLKPVEEDCVPYLGEPSVPSKEWPEGCRRTLEYRKNNRNYIYQYEDCVKI